MATNYKFQRYYKIGTESVVCNHERPSDFTTSWTGEVVEHLYCTQCGWHKFRGIEYTRDEWREYINAELN